MVLFHLIPVDRVIILRFNEEEMELEILMDKTIEDAKSLMSERTDGKLAIAMTKIYKPTKKVRNDDEVVVSKSAAYEEIEIRELENASIVVYESGIKQAVVKPVLRKIAGLVSVLTVNSKGNPYNTRQLGTLLIQTLNPK